MIDTHMPPLRGIVHAAMVIEDALLRDMERGQLHRVLAPKICGAMHCTRPPASGSWIFSFFIRRRPRCLEIPAKVPTSLPTWHSKRSRHRTPRARPPRHVHRLGSDRRCRLLGAQ